MHLHGGSTGKRTTLRYTAFLSQMRVNPWPGARPRLGTLPVPCPLSPVGEIGNAYFDTALKTTPGMAGLYSTRLSGQNGPSPFPQCKGFTQRATLGTHPDGVGMMHGALHPAVPG